MAQSTTLSPITVQDLYLLHEPNKLVLASPQRHHSLELLVTSTAKKCELGAGGPPSLPKEMRKSPVLDRMALALSLENLRDVSAG